MTKHEKVAMEWTRPTYTARIVRMLARFDAADMRDARPVSPRMKRICREDAVGRYSDAVLLDFPPRQLAAIEAYYRFTQSL